MGEETVSDVDAYMGNAGSGCVEKYEVAELEDRRVNGSGSGGLLAGGTWNCNLYGIVDCLSES